MLKRHLDLFFSFFRIGLFAFSPEYSAITLLRKEIVEKRGWMSEKDIADIAAISGSTPGSISVSSSTFIGCRIAGFSGALAATAGVIAPSVLIMSVVSFFMKGFADNVYVNYALSGIRCALLALIINAALLLFKQMGKHYLNYIVMAVSFILLVFFRMNVITVLVIDIVAVSIAVHFVDQEY